VQPFRWRLVVSLPWYPHPRHHQELTGVFCEAAEARNDEKVMNVAPLQSVSWKTLAFDGELAQTILLHLQFPDRRRSLSLLVGIEMVVQLEPETERAVCTIRRERARAFSLTAFKQ